jgi:hypothetical protein
MVQRDATGRSLFYFTAKISTCFGCQHNPSSGVHKIVFIASGRGHSICMATSFQRGQVRTSPRWSEVAVQILGPVTEAVITVLCTPDDGCCRHPKHVEILAVK